MHRFDKLHTMWADEAGLKLQQGQLMNACMELMVLLLPIWLSVMVGLLVGWSWRPRWASLLVVALRSRPRLAWSFPPGFGARRLWLAATAAAAAPTVREVCQRVWAWLRQLVEAKREREAAGQFAGGEADQQRMLGLPVQGDVRLRNIEIAPLPAEAAALVVAAAAAEDESVLVGSADLEALCRRLEGLDGGPEWAVLMEKEAPGMKYTAWRRDPQAGPTEYRSCSLIEACSPELMRDFFWDDEFRLSSRWDDMLVHSDVVEECQRTGVQVVQWVRKFPFFCKDREYIIGRRIWSLDGTYYCVTKGVTHPAVPLKDKPRRVSVFYSSWRIRAVENGGCEVMLFHHEDMGIQRSVAKMGIRQGMWPAVRKIEPGVREYQRQREQQPSHLSRSASMANIHTPISPCGPALTRVWHSVSDLGRADLQDSESAGVDTRQEEQAGARGVEELSQMQAAAGEWGEGTEKKRPGDLDGCWQQQGQQDKKKRARVGWLVTGSIVLVACGVSPSLVWKVLLAGTARNIVGRRLRNKGADNAH